MRLSRPRAAAVECDRRPCAGAVCDPDMLREFFLWWFGQLAGLLPARLRRAGLVAEDALVVAPGAPLDGGADSVNIGLRRGGRETSLGRFALGPAGARELPSPGGRPVVMRLGASDILAKSLTLPLAAERDLHQVLAFEMDRETPFAVDEVYWSHRVAAVDRRNGKLQVRLLLMPQARLQPLLAGLAQLGLTPRRVEISDGPDAGHYLPLDGNGGRLHRTAGRVLWPAAALCAVLAAACIAAPFLRQATAIAAVERRVEAGQTAAAEAEKFRREISRLAHSADLVQKERDKAGRPVAVLAETTRILPDDTYLAELELQHRKLTLSGRSAAAARLIGKLAAAGLQNPAFAAPVTRLEALHAEVFTLTAEVEQ
jgi:general secretion pathway protein L